MSDPITLEDIKADDLVRLVQCAIECAADLEAEINARHGTPAIGTPQSRRKWRDLEPVRNMRDAVRAMRSHAWLQHVIEPLL